MTKYFVQFNNTRYILEGSFSFDVVARIEKRFFLTCVIEDECYLFLHSIMRKKVNKITRTQYVVQFLVYYHIKKRISLRSGSFFALCMRCDEEKEVNTSAKNISLTAG